ncbi:MAG: pimeloyl-ACP methyl ester carboxylesterase [Crocinitomicaceae bacterium]|jgi:pimeloyl-ACP methyl ester carboxylesterase
MNSKRLKKIVLRSLMVLVGIYIIGCGYMYFQQEGLLFHPEKLKASHQFQFENKFEERNIGGKINPLSAVLFKASAEKSEKVVFYLHGNSGNIQTSGDVTKSYTNLGYDVFVFDYRGFGKSKGEIETEKDLYSDAQRAYYLLKQSYGEENIIVVGYSLGTAIAAYIGAQNNPRKLILQAPYYSMTDMMKKNYPIVPTFLLKYKLETYKYVQDCKMPIVIFHGDQDKVIPFSSSVRLKKLLKKGDKLIALKGQGHGDIGENKKLLRKLPRVLNN